MRVMDELTEAHRRTPSFQHAGNQSPRVGSSCAGAVYHFIQDWSLSKRFSSTKCIIAERLNQDALYGRADVSLIECASPAASKPTLKEEFLSSSKTMTSALPSTPSPASVKSDATSKRSPGVVARLMGLESLPERTCNSFSKSGTLHTESPALLGPPPLLLPELLRLELSSHSKKSFKDKLPGFTKKGPDPKGAMPQKKKPGSSVREQGHPYVNPRAPKPSSVQEDLRGSSKQPFLARLKSTGASPAPPSKPQNTHSPSLPSMFQKSHSPILSPAMLGARSTVRLLEAAVKALEPPSAPRRKHTLPTGDSNRSDSGRSEKRAFGSSSYGRGVSPASSATKPGRSQSRSVKDDRPESNAPASRSTSRAPSRQLSRTRHDATVVAAAPAPVQSQRSRPTTPKRIKESSRPLLRTHEASVRGFKTELGDSPLGKKLKKNDSRPQAVEPEKPVATQSSKKKRNSAEPGTPDPNPETAISQSELSSPTIVPEKPRGFRSIRFRSRGGKHETSIAPSPPNEPGEFHCKDQGKHDSPTQAKPVAVTPPKEAKGTGFSYNMFRKQGNKREGSEPGDALVVKRTDSTWMRHLMRKPSSVPGTSKLSEKVNVEVTEVVELQEALSSQMPASSPTQHQEGPNVVQARYYRSIDDVFPELPMEEKDARRHSPELAKNIRAVEELQSLRHDDEDYRSIERMFGKEFCRSRMAAELTSPEMSPAPGTSPECGVPGTFPNSPKMDSFSSISQLNLHDSFEVASGSRSHELGRRRSFCLSEPRERVLNEADAEEVESDTCSNCVGEHLENFKFSVAAGWMTPPALREFEEKLAQEGVMSTPPSSLKSDEDLELEDATSTPPALKKFEQELEHEANAVSTPPALKNFEEKLSEHEARAMSTPPALKNFEEKLSGHEACAMSTPPALKEFVEKLQHEDASSTPPALKEFEEKLQHEDASSTPPALKEFEEKLALEGVMTPPALKKFEEKLPQGYSDIDDSHVSCPDEFGQPSPVSVLQSPFLDEIPTTPDASLAEAQRVGDTEASTIKDDDDDDVTQEANENTATSKLSNTVMPETIQTDMIEQAIRDISRIRSIHVTKCGLEPHIIAPVEPQQELNYVREVLQQPLKGDFRCHSVVNQSLFKRLEFGSKTHIPRVRSERKLLFDSVYEVMALEPWLKTSSFYVELPMFPDLHANSKFRSPISGEELVQEVYRMFCHWKDIAGNCLDDLIDYDMNVPEGRWVNFGHEIADIGLDIERTLLHVLIAEVVDDLGTLTATRR